MQTASGLRSGMTSTEFVIVVGTTLIVAAVLFPTLSGLREYGRRSTC